MNARGLVLLLACLPAWAQAADATRLPAAATEAIDFARDVRPIFETHCQSCHGAEKQRSGFRLDLRDAAMAGGDLGVAIVPGKSAESRLIHLIAGLEQDLVMPPKGERLTSRQIAVLRAWIDQGAGWPDDGASEAAAKERLNHWAFQPVTHPEPPDVRRASWPRNDLDRFILARLEQAGLEPSPEADRRTLVRRLFFDVTGLPPTPADVRKFLSDPNPRVYEALVDRLLDSPQYGERWARHWLDVVHYGESHGYDKDKPRMNAWPYRDYVIRSLNNDKPYSRFIQEQLAGDVLFPDDPEGIPALGFIAAGPWDFVGHVELPESKTDGLIARYNDRDDMVMTTLSTTMSLTVHCARCHDHKFDPIPQADYYALQAVFAGVDRADRPYDANPAIHQKRRALLEEKAELALVVSHLEGRLAEVTTEEVDAINAALEEKRKALAALTASAGAASPGNGYHSGIEANQDTLKWVQVDLAEPQDLAEIRLVPARPTDFADTPGFGFPRRFRVEVSDDPEFKSAKVLLDRTAADVENPGDKPVVIEAPQVRGRYVRVTAVKLWERTSDYVFALAELEVISKGTNAARLASVQALDSIESGRWGKARLIDGFDSRKRLSPEVPDAVLEERKRELRAGIDALSSDRLKRLLVRLDPKERDEYSRATQRLAVVESELAAMPPSQWVYAAANRFNPQGSFRPAAKPRPVHLLRRGDVKLKGDLVNAGALSCFPWLPDELELANPDNEGERRAALARWLTAPENGLFRRSIVNRLWHHHFGRGLVDTPNDFGRMGSLPSHPELLDWLANWFQEQGESWKAFHRLVLTSATYRQSSESRPAAEAVDSDNRLLWRMNRTRLDAESLRDAVLVVSGRLDPAMGGAAVQQFWFKDDHSPTYDYTRFDVDSAAGSRRSIYRFIVRSVPDPFMDTLDCPDSSILTPKRNETLTALQALALLNNPFVLRQAEHFAARLESESRDVEDQVRAAYVTALAREPSAAEVDRLGAYARRHGLASACRVLFNSNEFIFLD